VRAEPDNALYRFHLGEAYQRSGNLVQARNEFTKALEIDPSFKGADQARQFVQRSR
jgi:Flp pilus assembly protein TadD